MLEQDVAHKTSSLSQVLLDLERRKNELEQRQDKLMREIRQRQVIEADLREANGRLQSSLTALERAQSQLLESEKMASLGGLVAGITHDVSTPLGISITAASYLRDQMQAMNTALSERKLTQQQLQEFLQTGNDAMQLLENNLSRASDLIGSFKQVAVDQTSESVREFNLKKYLQEVIQSLRPRWKNTQHQIELECDDSITLTAPAGAFAQIFTNLIVNSLFHGFEAQVRGHIQIVVRAIDDQQLQFIYRDNGKGLTAEQMEKLFDPFFTTKRQQGGSGLGTHIIRNLVTQTLHGTINASSEVGKGLTYEFIIPVNYRQL
ncbi:MAG: Sensor kinase CckA [Pseudidiomarina mangrovi]|nr:MAG: Sensor kinase CckA [Pseudidiomarina mangrovi]